MDRRKLLLVVAVIVAMLGAALVFVYVQSADKRAQDQYDTVEVLTAIQPIMTGETIAEAAEAGKLQRTRIPQTVKLPSAVATVDSLKGLAANTNIYAGEQIVTEKFGGVSEASALPIPEGLVAVAVELTDPSRVAGFVQAGSTVSIWLTGDEATVYREGKWYTRLVTAEAQVLAAGSTTLVEQTSTDEEGNSTTEELPRTLLTLAVDQEQAEKIKLAAAIGELSFALINSQSKVEPGPARTFENLFR
ncbi:Flp pilus assembly protein CpaB [Nocardioides gilvus]|uniref:Flp pilus assembly protein CpaB n=1 Tax=Nocardioides gilvus TaxID=1735589 RepID=UPI000D746388|nr:Flp pilus assembly protein CpaB [Nocardioides gilvus]